MFSRRKCYCMNNNYSNNSCEMQNDIMETKCNNVVSYEENPNSKLSLSDLHYKRRIVKSLVGNTKTDIVKKDSDRVVNVKATLQLKQINTKRKNPL